MLYIIKCALLLISLGESLFLPAFSVCGFRFSEVACEILPSVLGWLHWLLHVLFVGQKKESLQLSICHLSCLYSLWCTCPLIFPGELEILRHPEPVASLISLCFNPNRTGTPFCHPLVYHIRNALHTARPQVHDQYLLTSPRSDTGSEPRPASSAPVMVHHDDIHIVDDKIQGHFFEGKSC